MAIVAERSENSFVGFIDDNQEGFDEFTDLARELRAEREAWKRSSVCLSLAEEFADIRIDMTIPPGKSLSQYDAKAVARFRRKQEYIITDVMFKDLAETAEIVRSIGLGENQILRKFEQNVPAKHRPRCEDWIEQYNNVTGELADQVFRPLGSALREVRQSIFGNLNGYLLSDYQHFSDFGNFLGEPKLASQREQIRPLLTYLSEVESKGGKDNGFLDKIQKEWVEQFLQVPSGDLYDRFWAEKISRRVLGLKSITAVGKKVVIDATPEFLQWLDFTRTVVAVINRPITTPEDVDGISDEEFGKVVLAIGLDRWPKPLRDNYTGFVTRDILSVYTRARDGLAVYRASTASLDFDTELSTKDQKRKAKLDRTRQSEVEEISEPEIVKPVLLPTAELRYTGSGFSYASLSEEELDSFICKDAGKIAPGDARMVEDCRAIVGSLRGEPRGWGTHKIGGRINVMGKKRFVFSFNPFKRNLSLSHELSADVRPLYVITEVLGQSTVVFDGLYKHRDYEDRMAFLNSK